MNSIKDRNSKFADYVAKLDNKTLLSFVVMSAQQVRSAELSDYLDKNTPESDLEIGQKELLKRLSK